MYVVSFDPCAISLPEVKGLVTDTPHFTTKTSNTWLLQTHNYRLGEQIKSVELADFSVQITVSLFRKRHPLLLTNFSTLLVTVQLQFYYSEKGKFLLSNIAQVESWSANPQIFLNLKVKWIILCKLVCSSLSQEEKWSPFKLESLTCQRVFKTGAAAAHVHHLNTVFYHAAQKFHSLKHLADQKRSVNFSWLDAIKYNKKDVSVKRDMSMMTITLQH